MAGFQSVSLGNDLLHYIDAMKLLAIEFCSPYVLIWKRSTQPIGVVAPAAYIATRWDGFLAP
jgi:hypothetical protein